MSGQKLQTAVRRGQIAEAALQLVASQGLKRLSIAAVARRVGLVPSGIYRHFKSKDDILAAVLDRIDQRLMANVEAARAESDDAMECLRGVLSRHIRFIREGRAIPRLIFSEDFHSGHPERKGRVHQILTAYTDHVAAIVRQGQQQGRIRPDVPPETAAMLFVGIVVPAGIFWHLTDGEFDVTGHADRAWRLFQTAVEVPGAK